MQAKSCLILLIIFSAFTSCSESETIGYKLITIIDSKTLSMFYITSKGALYARRGGDYIFANEYKKH